MKKALLITAMALSVAACTRVDPGHVGVKVNRYGSDAGVESKALGVGTYQTMFGVDIYEYPIYTNNFTWGRAGKDADGNDLPNNEMAFQDRNGLIVTGDVAVAYRVDPIKAPVLFQKYRTGMDGIVAGPLRNAVRSAIVDTASNMTVEEIYGPKKTVLINRSLLAVRKYFEPFGLHVEQLYWAGPVRIPENILERINARAQNEQAAIAAQANVATIEAQARAEVAKAEGQAKAQTVRAQAQAESMRIQAQALEANPKLVQYEWVRKWDGRMPGTVYCSANAPCVQGAQ
ncbi:SPFH domain-containing protein [Sphingobium yanoikuyae]|uniref:SPFH domain-containing protein n=1 Tax=Sphingobium yanoikuyae TaxID=13690 RepID=UPI001EFF4EC2|nr:SPFH domain-containing protein [Sphingobium yanoikuyae]